MCLRGAIRFNDLQVQIVVVERFPISLALSKLCGNDHNTAQNVATSVESETCRNRSEGMFETFFELPAEQNDPRCFTVLIAVG